MSEVQNYFVVMLSYPRRLRGDGVIAPACCEAIVDPEITRREVIARLLSREYDNVSFIHEIADGRAVDVTLALQLEASAMAEAA